MSCQICDALKNDALNSKEHHPQTVVSHGISLVRHFPRLVNANAPDSAVSL